MPVSFTVATHPATVVPLDRSYTAEELLARTCPEQYQSARVVLGSSFSFSPESESKDRAKDSTSLGKRFSKLNPFTKSNPGKQKQEVVQIAPSAANVIPTPNGFVNTIISAYNKHHNLIIRPDDVWIDVLTQFNFYVNANAELLRANFVAHDGTKELKVETSQQREDMDFAALSREMVGLLEKNVVDPTLRAWVLPDFSTTTLRDKTVGAIVMMSTLKAYFEYVFETIDCGIPRVTLEGTKADWEDILRRLEKLKEYGIETIAWYHLLVPVIKRFVRAFDAPESPENVEFWQTVAHYIPGGSGPSHYSGWINAFCAFDPEGKWIGRRLRKSNPNIVQAPESLSAEAFWDAYLEPNAYSRYSSKFVLDGTPFHCVESLNVPSAYVHVPVKLTDRNMLGDEWPCVMVAGVVGTLVSSGSDGTMNTVQPVTSWWIYRKRE